MSGVEIRTVIEADAGMRLDRWFKRHFPGIPHGRLERLLRTGQVRIDGGRAKAGSRVAEGSRIRVPPLADGGQKPHGKRRQSTLSADEARALEARVLHIDDDVIAFAKPAGLAVQGGSKITSHLDDMLGALSFGKPEPPRLVHRLDKDTSGVLLLARDRKAASRLGAAFRSKAAIKTYWALVVGLPRPARGRIDAALEKIGAGGHQRMRLSEGGKRAITEYAVVEAAARRASWLVLRPLTGRTHQLRVHCAALRVPIVGDGKYGGREAFLTGGVSRKLHLHARALTIPHPAGGTLDVTAPLEGHMLKTWQMLGFDPEAITDQLDSD